MNELNRDDSDEEIYFFGIELCYTKWLTIRMLGKVTMIYLKKKLNKLYKVIYIHSLKQYSIIFFNRVCSTLFMLDWYI